MKKLETGEVLELAGKVLAQSEPLPGVDAVLVAALCRAESGCYPGAVRYEADYLYTIAPVSLEAGVRPVECSLETEAILQRCSLGLMQVMGATARELGFKGWLTGLLEPETGVRWGVKYLQHQHRRYFSLYGLDAVIAAYNAGSMRTRKSGEFVNQAYVDRVRRVRQRLNGQGGKA